MENSPFFDGIREEWEARGKAKGRVEGRAEGQLEVLLVLLETKFGRVPGELKEHLTALKDQEQISQAVRKAISTDTVDEYMAEILK
ncbi:MAG: hypothetical protein HQP61_00135 [Peptococcaceae bacterium]|nr:hypothetical protein [Candidatus Syntrophopropionicum ammoniitolerans]